VDEFSQIGDLDGVGGEAGEFFGRGEKDASRLRGEVEQARELVNLRRVEGRAFDAELG